VRKPATTSATIAATNGYTTPPAPPEPPIIEKPKWDAMKGELWIGGKRRPVAKQAVNLRTVLDGFETAKWPPRVNSPFARIPETHHNVIRALNTGLQSARFSSATNGTEIRWEKREPTEHTGEP
jgi:hypothetical protein